MSTDQQPDREQSIFEEAMEIASPEERQAFLNTACAGEPAFRARVDALLHAHADAPQFLSDNSTAVAAVTQQPGDRIGRYKLLERIGEGGWGVVYRAEQEEPVRRHVAIKVIKLGMDTKSVIARFEAERQALALMDHPNIAKVLDAGATDTGRPYFVMELVKGVRITDYCDQNNLPTRERLNLFTQVCHAIQHAHQKGIIHRDIKPSNILVTLHAGVPVPTVIDFGIAKATSDQRLTDKTFFTAFEQFIGTPAYMSPEQAEKGGLDIDTRSDIYAMGVLLYELLTGRTPFDAKRLLESGLDEIRRIIREEEPPRPSTRLNTLAQADLTDIAKLHQSEPAKLTSLMRGDLDWIVMKCLQKDRTRRYETASGLASDIAHHLNNEPVIAGPPSNLYRFQKLVRRNKLAFAAGATIAAVLVVAVVVTSSLAVLARRAGRQAKSEAERADRNAASEKLLRERGEAAAAEAKLALSTSDFLQACRSIAEGKDHDAVAYLVASLRANPTNDAAVTRLATLLAYRTWLWPILDLQHAESVLSAEFSPDGKRVVTASADHTARVWDAQTGQPLTGPLQHAGGVLSARFSPDGKRVVTASRDRTAREWDAQTGQPLIKPLEHAGWVLSARFSRPDGKRVVTASADSTARVWDAQTGQPLTDPLKHQHSRDNDPGSVLSVQFSPDGKRVVTASEDWTARVWDAQTGQQLIEPLKHGNWVSSARFSPNGKQVATASRDGTARVWDAQTGQPLTGPLQHAGWVYSVQFSPDGKQVVTASADRTARVWDAQPGQPLTKPLKHAGSVYSAHFSPDGKRVVTASDDSTARVWHAETGQPLSEPLQHAQWVYLAEFSPDGKRVLTASRDRTARVWDAHTGQLLTEPLKHAPWVTSAQFSPDDRRVVTASADGTAQVWDAQTGQPLTGPLKHAQWVYSAQFSPDGKRVVTASFDGTAQVWDAQTGQPLTKSLKHASGVRSAQFSPDGKWVVTASWDRTARVWDAKTGLPLTKPLQHLNTVDPARFSPDGKRVVTASEDNTAQVWNAQTGQPLTKPLQHAEWVSSAQFSPDGKRVVTASRDHTARVWDAQTGQPLTEPLEHAQWVIYAQFSPDGKRVVTASLDNTARVWDAQTGQPLTEPIRHADWVWSAQFSPDGKRVATASRDHTAQVWDAQTGQPLTEPLKHASEVQSAHFSSDGKRVVTASKDGTARVWDIAPPSAGYPVWLLELATAVCGEVMSAQGVLEFTNQVQALNQLRQTLSSQPGSDDWLTLGRWILADPLTRTISPFSQVTVPEYIEHRIKENTADSLAEAERQAKGNPELSEQIARARKTNEQKRPPEGTPILNGHAFFEKYIYDRGYFGKLTTNNPARWKEGNTDSTTAYYFVELKRDEQVILLRDAVRDITIQIPLAGGESRYSRDDGATWHRLYHVLKE